MNSQIEMALNRWIFCETKKYFQESNTDNIWRILVITQLESTYLLLGFDADEKTGVTTIGSILRLKQASQISLDGEGQGWAFCNFGHF